jgi:hypothetical protein
MSPVATDLHPPIMIGWLRSEQIHRTVYHLNFVLYRRGYESSYFSSSSSGGCHCRDRFFLSRGPVQHISLTPPQQEKEKDRLAWHFDRGLVYRCNVFRADYLNKKKVTGSTTSIIICGLKMKQKIATVLASVAIHQCIMQ